MIINRNNYEEYFLLYADKELSKTERKVVEIFVQENPDLKEEFSMMKLTINAPDKEIKLLDKSFLLKQESPLINENNYEQIFVLYHDHELSDEQKKQTQDFILENRKFKTDFELIGKTRLIPDHTIVYPGKKQLCRKEKSGKVIPLIFWRSIAAAVVIGVGLWIAIPYINTSEVSQPVATSTNTTTQKPIVKNAKPDTNIISEKPAKEENNIASSTKTTEPEQIKKNKPETETTVLKEQKIKVPKPDVDYQLAISDKPVKELPAFVEKTGIPLKNEPMSTQENKIKTEVPEVAHTQTVSYNPDADTNNQNYVFYDVTSDEFNKSKVGGFLKKVKRVVERSNPIRRLLTESDLVAK